MGAARRGRSGFNPLDETMALVALIAVAAGLVWGVVYARRGSLVFATAMLLVVAYVFGYQFWNVHLGPLPLTLDRLMFAGIVAAFIAQWRWGRVESKPLTGVDWLLAATLAILTASAILAGKPEVLPENASSPMWRLVMSFAVPALIYCVARQSRLTHRAWCGWLAVMALLGGYLALTALAEIAEQWAFVFPRYISDPTLGIHFGRARGPELNSASLGVYLTACFWCVWTLRPQVSRGCQLVLLAMLPLIASAVFFTYTRSTWIGLLASAAVVGFFEIPRAWRLPLFTVAALGGILIAAVAWNDVVGLEREGSAGDSHHSVDQRKSFAYVSWQMFRDHPVLGVGFGRFYDRKMPYLSDRSQEFELESLRSLHHHNTLLSILVETGLVGLAAFLALLAALAWNAWQLTRDPRLAGWMRSQGVLMLAVLVTYLSSAVFHDLTLLPSQQWLLLAFAGLTMNLRLGTNRQPSALGSKAKLDLTTSHFHAST